MNIVHLVVVKNSFYILESGRTIRKSAHFSLILGTKNLVKVGTQQVCTPHLNRYDRPIRNRKIVEFRPLPSTSIQKFGSWIVGESWSDVVGNPSHQASIMEAILKSKLDTFCPIKTKRLSSHDKPYITPEIKQIDRRRNREYLKRGKTEKYFELKKVFEK